MWLFFLPSKPVHKLQELPPKSGIYYITALWIVFYVGKAVNLRQRWRNHHRLAQFQRLAPFGRLHYRLVPKHALNAYERREIQRLKPLWNYQPIPRFWGLLSLCCYIWLSIIIYATLAVAIAFCLYALYLP